MQDEYEKISDMLENGYELIYKRLNLLRINGIKIRYQVFLEGGGINNLHYDIDLAIKDFLKEKRRRYK